MRTTVFFIPLLFVVISCSSTDKKGYSGLGLASVSQKDLQKFAPAPANSELKSDIEKLVDIRSTTPGLISKTGQGLFTTWNVTGSSQIWKINSPKSFPEQLTGGEDAARLAAISPDDQWIVFHRDSKGDENFGIYLMGKNGGPAKKVFYSPKAQASFLFFSEDSRSLYYRVNDKEPSSYAIYRYHLHNDQVETVWDQPGIWFLSDVKGSKAVLSQQKGSMQNEHFLLDLKTKKTEPLMGQNETEDYSVHMTNNPGEYLVLTNKLDDHRRLYLFKNKEFKPITPDYKADVKSLVLSHNRRNVVFVINKDGYTQGKWMDLANRRIRALPVQGAIEQTYLGDFSTNDRYFTFGTEHHNEPLRNYVLNTANFKAQPWTISSTPEVKTQDYVRGELLSYKAEDGTDIPMFVWRSQKCKQQACPVIVQFHGGPEAQFIPRFSPIYNYYTEQDFVFVAPNVRGSDGYGKKWLQADNKAGRLKTITDIRDCALFIKKNWQVNGQERKVGIMGGSYGGYSTLVGMSKFAGTYDAGVAIVGMSSLITFIENTAPYRRALRINEYGDPSTSDREFMEQLSPITYVQQVKEPLLILHGATDPRVPVGEALQFYNIIKSKNKDSGLVIFPDEGHGVAKRPNIVLLHSYTLDFFKKHLR